MRNIVLAAGVAAMAIASPALAQGRGNGQGNGPKAERNEERREARQERREEQRERRQEAREDRQDRAEDRRDRERDRAEARRDRMEDRIDRERDRAEDRRDRRVDRYEDRLDRDRDRRYDDNLGDRIFREVDRNVFRYGDNQGRYSDCPPGLAKKRNGCLPPGQAKKLWGQRAPQSLLGSLLGGAYSTWYPDDEYRYRMGDDFIYRIGANGIIDGLIPRYDRPGYFYPVGSYYPEPYDFYNVPTQYRGYYDDPYYRYGDGAIYRIDPETRLIQSIAALLTGDAIVGQPLPSSYSVYNVPYGYRDRYYDNDQDWYRYSDGYIYRVEPETLIVAEVLDAII